MDQTETKENKMSHIPGNDNSRITNDLNGRTYYDRRPDLQVIKGYGSTWKCLMTEDIINMDPSYANDLPFGILDPDTTNKRTLHDFIRSAVTIIKYELCIRHKSLHKAEMNEIEFDLMVNVRDVPEVITERMGLKGKYKTLVVEGETYCRDTDNTWMVVPQLMEGVSLLNSDTRKKCGVELADWTE